jgi:hypothetical protein
MKDCDVFCVTKSEYYKSIEAELLNLRRELST